MAENYQKGFPVSWDQLHRDSRALAWRLADLGPWKGVIAITRGGLVPSAIVARELELRMIDTVCVASYDHQDQGGLNVLKQPPGDGDGMLLVDDLVDTGRTARVVREILPKAHFATVYAKPAGPWSTPSSPRSVRTPGYSSPGTPNCNSSRPSSRPRPAAGSHRSHGLLGER